MVKGKTASGFEYEIDERVFSDWRLLGGLKTMSSNKSSEIDAMNALFDVAEFVLGDKLHDYVEYVSSQNDGYADSAIITDEIMEIITSNKKSKN